MLERWTGKAPRNVKHQKDDAAGVTALFHLVSERRVIRTPRVCVCVCVARWHKRIAIEAGIKPSCVGKLSQIDGLAPAPFKRWRVFNYHAVIDRDGDPCIGQVFGVDNNFKCFRRAPVS